MFRAVVQTTLGIVEIPLVQKALAHLAVGDGQPLFVSDYPVILQSLTERLHRFRPPLLARFLKGKVVVENAEGAVIVQVAKEIQGLHIIGLGFGRLSGADMQVAQIDQSVGDGMSIVFDALNGQHFTIAALGRCEVFEQRAGVSEIAQRIGEFTQIVGSAVFLNGGFPGRSRLHQIAAVEEDPRTMLVIIRHELAATFSLLLWACHV